MEQHDKYADLEKLNELLEKGILTKEEFEIEKSKILNRPSDYSQNHNSVKKDNSPINIKNNIPKNKTKWYNKGVWMCLSLLFWPLFVYGLFKTELISKKSKKIILISFLSLAVFSVILGIILHKDPYKMNQFLNDGKITVKWQDGEYNREIQFRFKNPLCI